MDEFQDPDEVEEQRDFEAVKKRADAKRRLILQGKDPNDYDNIEEMLEQDDLSDLADMGFGVEWE